MDVEALSEAVLLAEIADPDARLILLGLLAGRELEPDPAELHASLRRSELLLAAGGDPRRPLEPDGRAVTALADDLDDPALRAALAESVASLRTFATGLPETVSALDSMLADDDLAWRCYAAALLAAALAGADEDEGERA